MFITLFFYFQVIQIVAVALNWLPTTPKLLPSVIHLYGQAQDGNTRDSHVTKGFGNKLSGASGVGKKTLDVVKATRPTVFREVRGQYARLLASKHSFLRNCAGKELLQHMIYTLEHQIVILFGLLGN